jgi:hypothetical protein
LACCSFVLAVFDYNVIANKSLINNGGRGGLDRLGAYPTKEQKGIAMREKLAWSALTLLLVAFVIGDIEFVTTRRMRGQVTGGVALGILFAQVTLLAVWVAWFPIHDLIRVPFGFACAFFVSWVAAIRSSNAESILFGGATFAQWFAIQLSLTYMRRVNGWGLVWPNQPSIRKEIPFGLRELFAWIALFASALSIALTILRDPSQFNLQFHLRHFMRAELILLLTAFGSLFAWSAIWAVLVAKRQLSLGMLAVACYVGICVAEATAFRVVLGRFSVYDETFWWARGIQFAVSSVGLLLVRGCGLRLHRPCDT